MAASPESTPSPDPSEFASGSDASESTVELGNEERDAEGTITASAGDTAELPPVVRPPEQQEGEKPGVGGWKYEGVSAPTTTQQERMQRRAETVNKLVFGEKEEDKFPERWVDTALRVVEKSAATTNNDVYERFGPDARAVQYYLQSSGNPEAAAQEAERRNYVTHMLKQLKEKPFQEVFGEITDRHGKQADDEMDALRATLALMRELGRGSASDKEELENAARTHDQKERVVTTLAADAAARLCDSHRIQARDADGIAADVRDKPDSLTVLEDHANRFKAYASSVEMPKKMHEHLARTQELIADAQMKLVNEQGVTGVAKQSLPPEMTMLLGDKFQQRVDSKKVPEEQKKEAAMARNTVYTSLAKGVTKAGTKGVSEYKADSTLLADLVQRIEPLQRDKYSNREERAAFGEAVAVLKSSHETASQREAEQAQVVEAEILEEPEPPPRAVRPPTTSKVTEMMQIMDDQGENPLERFGYLDAAATYGLDMSKPADQKKAEKRRKYFEEVLMDDLEIHQHRQGGRWATLQAGMTSLAARVNLNGFRGLRPDKKQLQDARADAVQALRQAVTDMRNQHTPTPENPVEANQQVLTGIDIVEEVANRIDAVKKTEPTRRAWFKRLLLGS